MNSAADSVSDEVGPAFMMLARLRLVVRVGGGVASASSDRGGKWRVNVEWEAIRSVGRSIGVEVEKWLVE